VIFLSEKCELAMLSDRRQSGNLEVSRRGRNGIPLLAWCVHAYTALGLVAAAAMAVLIVRGGAAAFRATFALMLVATLIDATDGLLARAVRVKDVLPGFDGRQLDYLTDFLTYVALPLLLVWRAEILPPGREAWLIVPLLAGAYWFCQVEAKTDDGYFLVFLPIGTSWRSTSTSRIVSSGGCPAGSRWACCSASVC